MKNCPKCDQYMIGVEYVYGDPNRYDGISEWDCPDCHTRIGRWTGKELKEGEQELRFGKEGNEGIKEDN